MSLIVFTDLDGSLLDHSSYSLDPARDALQRLAEKDVPLILNSSKTAVEILSLKAEENLIGDYICENGAALQRTTGELIEFGDARDSWLGEIHALRQRRDYLFKGFSDWSTEEVALLTGLDPTQASMAKARSYSEPILWLDTPQRRAEFEEELRQRNLCLLEGGRFQSIQSGYDKADAMRWLVERTQSTDSRPLLSVALGDSPNDLAMLNAAEIAVVIATGSSDRTMRPAAPCVIHTEKTGPEGWQLAIEQILEFYDSGRPLEKLPLENT